MSNSGNLPAVQQPQGVTNVTQGFGTTGMTVAGETSAAAMAARARAEVEARYVMAMERPRSTELWRQRLLKEAARPGLAEMAEYARPVGKEQVNGEWVEKIAKGPTIHLLRVAFQLYGNAGNDARIVYETDQMRTVQILITDYETNSHWTRDITFSKLIEKRGTKRRSGEIVPPDREVLAERTNSYGEPVFICRMNLDEVRKEEARLIALAKRQLLEEFLPRDVVREALALAVAVVQRKIKEDPEGSRRRMLDAFQREFSVSPVDIAAYLGHTAEHVTDSEIEQLRTVYRAIEGGEVTWAEVMEMRSPTGSAAESERVASEKLAAMAAMAGGKKDNPSERATDDKGAVTSTPSGPAEPATQTGQQTVAESATAGAAPHVKHQNAEPVTAEQLATLRAMASKGTRSLPELCHSYGVAKMEELPKAMYQSILAILTSDAAAAGSKKK